MREIKFRAWCKLDKILYDWEQVKKEFTLEYFDDRGLVFQQYTGLKDENGVEIYEGDIVKIQVHDRLDWNSITGKVVFLEGGWTVEDVGNFAIALWSEVNEVEVIGNIHDNPELLKTKKSS